MEKIQIDSQPKLNEPKLNESPDALWKNFEKTGSVSAYLRYVEKMKSSQDGVSSRLPS